MLADDHRCQVSAPRSRRQWWKANNRHYPPSLHVGVRPVGDQIVRRRQDVDWIIGRSDVRRIIGAKLPGQDDRIAGPVHLDAGMPVQFGVPLTSSSARKDRRSAAAYRKGSGPRRPRRRCRPQAWDLSHCWTGRVTRFCYSRGWLWPDRRPRAHRARATMAPLLGSCDALRNMAETRSCSPPSPP